MKGLLTIRLAYISLSAATMIFGLERQPARAQVFTLDTNRSSVTISGTVAGAAVATQGPGSLTTAIGGTIQVALVGNTIQFIGQSQIMAETNGSWQPKSDGTAGSQPADFGGQANLGIAAGFAALRDILLDAISPAINIVSGQFNSTNLTFLFPSNSVSTLAYNFTGLLSSHGSAILSGYATNKVTSLASLGTVNNQQVLTIPVDATFLLTLISANDTTIRLQGQLVAVQNEQAPLQLSPPVIQNQSVLLQWQAAPGAQYQVQSSTNFSTWQTNATVVAPASGMGAWTGAISGPVQFYRVAK